MLGLYSQHEHRLTFAGLSKGVTTLCSSTSHQPRRRTYIDEIRVQGMCVNIQDHRNADSTRVQTMLRLQPAQLAFMPLEMPHA